MNNPPYQGRFFDIYQILFYVDLFRADVLDLTLLNVSMVIPKKDATYVSCTRLASWG